MLSLYEGKKDRGWIIIIFDYPENRLIFGMGSLSGTLSPASGKFQELIKTRYFQLLLVCEKS